MIDISIADQLERANLSTIEAITNVGLSNVRLTTAAVAMVVMSYSEIQVSMKA
jgi:hypothetical protein